METIPFFFFLVACKCLLRILATNGAQLGGSDFDEALMVGVICNEPRDPKHRECFPSKMFLAVFVRLCDFESYESEEDCEICGQVCADSVPVNVF